MPIHGPKNNPHGNSRKGGRIRATPIGFTPTPSTSRRSAGKNK